MHTGSVVRGLNPDLKGMSSPVAPQEYNRILNSTLMHTLKDAALQNTFPMVAIEAIPRSLVQVEWLAQAATLGYTPIVLNMNATVRVRRSRVSTRNLNDLSRQAVDDAKMEVEDMELVHAVQACRNINIATHDIDTSQFVYTMSADCYSCPMLVQASNIQQEKRTYKSMDKESIVSMIKHMQDELFELQKAVCNNEDVVEELVDALWFFVAISRGLKVTCNDLMRGFRMKSSIVQFRSDTGIKPGLNIGEK